MNTLLKKLYLIAQELEETTDMEISKEAAAAKQKINDLWNELKLERKYGSPN